MKITFGLINIDLICSNIQSFIEVLRSDHEHILSYLIFHLFKYPIIHRTTKIWPWAHLAISHLPLSCLFYHVIVHYTSLYIMFLYFIVLCVISSKWLTRYNNTYYHYIWFDDVFFWFDLIWWCFFFMLCSTTSHIILYLSTLLFCMEFHQRNWQYLSSLFWFDDVSLSCYALLHLILYYISLLHRSAWYFF